MEHIKSCQIGSSASRKTAEGPAALRQGDV
jgi:hypothetical protein